LLGDGDKGIEKVYGEEKYFVLGRPDIDIDLDIDNLFPKKISTVQCYVEF
jgi:hypothetical protein